MEDPNNQPILQPHLLHNSTNIHSSSESFVLTTSYLTVTFLVLVAVQFFYRFQTKSGKNGGDEKKVLGLDDIPGPKPFVPIKLIGSLPYLLPFSNSLKQGLKWYLEYPAIGKMYGGNKTIVGITSGPLVQQFLKSTDFGHNCKAPVVYDNMKPFITNGLLVSTGKFWQGQRKILMKSQSFQSLKAYMGMLNKHSENFADEMETLFQDGKPHQINGPINILFLKVICEMITGFNVTDSPEFDHYHHNFQIWKESLLKRILNPWLLLNFVWRLHPMAKVLDKAVNENIDFARRRLREHKEKRPMSSSPAEEDSDKAPFRSVLEELVDAGVEEDQIIDEVNTMIFGGHETGATTIHFFCFCMALNQDIQEQCRIEIDELFNNPDCFKNGAITYEALNSNLRYVERCILETLRLFPPVFIFLRELKSPLTLEHEDKTFLLPVGVNILLSPWAMHRDPVVFPDPDRFDPDRFLPEVASKRHAYSYIPFSAGQRNCLGQKFGMMEMKIIVAYLLRRFVLTTTDKMEDIALLPFITMTPERDYMFEFEKRVL